MIVMPLVGQTKWQLRPRILEH